MNRFAPKFRRARISKGLSQLELSQRANMSQQQISRIESSHWNPTVASLEAVAKALGMRLGMTLTEIK